MDDTLAKLIRDCPTLPTLPAVALEVLELTQKADVDMAAIALVLEKDPALASRILKAVNSAYYARAHKISTISQALVVLGLQSVKTLVLGFSLVEDLHDRKAAGFDHIRYWRHTVHTAAAAREIADHANLIEREEAFLVGLLADIGMLVLDEVLGSKYGQICQYVNSHEELATAEMAELGTTHAEVGGFLAELWRLPPLLVEPIRHHVQPDRVGDPEVRRLTELARLAGRAADVYVDESAAEAIADVRRLYPQVVGEQSQASAEDVRDADAMLRALAQQSKELAETFEIQLGPTVKFETILRDANERLIELSLQSQQQAVRLEEQNRQLNEREQQLLRAATTDSLTGLLNRAEFDRMLDNLISAACSGGQPLSLIMCDIDRFKNFNDTYGHPVGDQVIRHISRLLRASARPGDIAARWGGEEMALVLRDADRGVAAAVAEQLRCELASKPVTVGSLTLPVTASFGVACFDQRCPLRTAAALFKAADMALYHAKETGRNRVKVFNLDRRAA